MIGFSGIKAMLKYFISLVFCFNLVAQVSVRSTNGTFINLSGTNLTISGFINTNTPADFGNQSATNLLDGFGAISFGDGTNYTISTLTTINTYGGIDYHDRVISISANGVDSTYGDFPATLEIKSLTSGRDADLDIGQILRFGDFVANANGNVYGTFYGGIHPTGDVDMGGFNLNAVGSVTGLEGVFSSDVYTAQVNTPNISVIDAYDYPNVNSPMLIFKDNIQSSSGNNSALWLTTDANFGINNGEPAGVGADINLTSVNGYVNASGIALLVNTTDDFSDAMIQVNGDVSASVYISQGLHGSTGAFFDGEGNEINVNGGIIVGDLPH